MVSLVLLRVQVHCLSRYHHHRATESCLHIPHFMRPCSAKHHPGQSSVLWSNTGSAPLNQSIWTTWQTYLIKGEGGGNCLFLVLVFSAELPRNEINLAIVSALRVLEQLQLTPDEANYGRLPVLGCHLPTLHTSNTQQR